MMANKILQDAAKYSDGTTIVMTNASGNQVKQLDTLKKIMKEEILCPLFFEYGLYLPGIWRNEKNTTELNGFDGSYCLSGNFKTMSFRYMVLTLDEKVMMDLSSLVFENMDRREFRTTCNHMYKDSHLVKLVDGSFRLVNDRIKSIIELNPDDLPGGKLHYANAIYLQRFDSSVIDQVIKGSLSELSSLKAA